MEDKIFDEILSAGAISTDTRTMGAGEAFFALVGENHDAHDHLDIAVSKGAAMLIVSDAKKAPANFSGRLILVDDTLRAYQELAAYYRQKLDPLVIAVTGSVGKTTLKDLIACVLSRYKRTAWTKGNLNNQIGLPRTILEANEKTEALVLEMGMETAGEIERLAEIARPDICAITNIGGSHRENFDSDEGILKAKYEIAAFLGKGDMLVVDAAQSPELVRLANEGSRRKGFDIKYVAPRAPDAEKDADYVFTETRVNEKDPGISLFTVNDIPFAIPMPGPYAGAYAAMTVAVCERAGIAPDDAAEVMKGFERTPHRLNPIYKNDILVIDDTYNASPDSAKSGLEYLKSINAKRRIAVFADMNQLGSDSDVLHMDVGASAVGAGVDMIYTFGEKADKIAAGAESALGQVEIKRFGPDEKDRLILQLHESLRSGDAVYIKGSRSMKMEEVVIALTEEI